MDLDLQSCARLLQTIDSNVFIKQGKRLHLLFLKRGVFPSSITMANRLLQMYARCGYFGDARKLFDEMPQRNCFTWNTMIEGYVKSQNKQEALRLFYAMPHKNNYSWNMIIYGFVKSAELNVARKFFEDMPMKDGVAWNSMIHGYAQNGRSSEALHLFKDLKSGCYGPPHVDVYILASVFGACTDLLVLESGKQIHTSIVVNGVDFDSVLASSIINMYGKCGDVDSARLVFDNLLDPDEFSLSALISAYSNCGRINDATKIFYTRNNPSVSLYNSLISGYIINNMAIKALLIFGEMRRRGVHEDASTIASVLSACDHLGVLEFATQVHAHASKFGFVHDLIVASVLVDTYAKCGMPDRSCELFNELKTHDTILMNSMIMVYSSCGRIKDAKRVFESIRSKTLISWNSMIVGLSQNNQTIDALECFVELNKIGFQTDRFSLASMISVCAAVSLIKFGEQLFARATVIGLESDQIVSTSLVDFYCKCGLIKNGQTLFDQTERSDEASWNAMLIGYATNGYGIEALDLFNRMIVSRFTPTEITFTAVLSACDHCGLLEEGLKWLYEMKCEYNIDPRIEHYSCVIDLLARFGRLDEAINLLENMPFEGDTNIWLSVLRGCLAHGNAILGTKVVKKIMMIEPKNADAYVQLSSLFAASGDWNRSAKVRKLMIDERIRKVPGTSWVDR